MATEDGFSDVVKRLDAIISLLSATLPTHERSLREQIKLLDDAGVEAAQIALIVKRPRTTVTSEVAKIRAKGGKKTRRKE